MAQFNEITGKTFEQIVGGKNDDVLIFKFTDGSEYKMEHHQDCCESVSIEDIDGDLQDMVGETVLLAEETDNSDNTQYGTCTWTFYKVQTNKHYATIRWYGESNGYYSESVSFTQTQAPTKVQEDELTTNTETAILENAIVKLTNEIKQHIDQTDEIDEKIGVLKMEKDELRSTINNKYSKLQALKIAQEFLNGQG